MAVRLRQRLMRRVIINKYWQVWQTLVIWSFKHNVLSNMTPMLRADPEGKTLESPIVLVSMDTLTALATR